jgi:hypothetical protein
MKSMRSTLVPRIAIVAKFVYFDECRDGICLGLREIGFRPELMSEIPVSDEWDVIFVIGVHLFPEIPWLSHTLVVGIQTEQMPVNGVATGRLVRNQRRYDSVCGYYDHLFEWNPDLYILRNDGRTFLPYGCVAEPYEDIGKKYDLAFIGNVGGSERRETLLEQLRCQFNFYPDYSPGFGDLKKQAIRESRILLNIHFYEGAGFESPRMFDYLSLGAFVLSERTAFSYPFALGVDFDDFGCIDDLVQKIQFYLKNNEHREKIAEQGRQTAQCFHYRACARIVALELQRQLSRRSSNVVRFQRWLSARLKCMVFQSKDWLSEKRRKILCRAES